MILFPHRSSHLHLALLAAGLSSLSCAMAQQPSPSPARPNTAILAAPRNEWMETHLKQIQIAKDEGSTVYFLGDSITNGWTNSKSGGPVWKTDVKPFGSACFGIGGDRTENVLWRLQNGILEAGKPKLAVLMIGTNNLSKNSPAEIAEGIRAIVAEIGKRSPETKVLILAIFPRDEKPDTDSRRKIAAINADIANLDDGSKVFYLDIGGKFLNADGTISKDIMPDFLHLSPAGYKIWADAMQDKLRALVGSPAVHSAPPAGA